MPSQTRIGRVQFACNRAPNDIGDAHSFRLREFDKRGLEAAHVDGHEVVVKVAHGRTKGEAEAT